jgi:DNA-binding NarL/FixJ family response regulator
VVAIKKVRKRALKVLIADDHTIVRQGLKQILKDTQGNIEVDEAENGHEVLEKVSRSAYSIILMDISMPDKSGIDVLKQIRQNDPKQKILIISIHPEEQYAVRALKAGADGYLTKESSPDELMNAIYQILDGETYVTSTIAQRLAIDMKSSGGKLPHETISDREYEILCMIAEGKSLTKIALELSLSVKTISTYRTRLLEKMNMKNNMQLTRYAIEYDLLN